MLTDALTVDEDRFYGAMAERLAALDHPRDRLRLLIDACVAEYDWTLWMELWARALRDRCAPSRGSASTIAGASRSPR